MGSGNAAVPLITRKQLFLDDNESDKAMANVVSFRRKESIHPNSIAPLSAATTIIGDTETAEPNWEQSVEYLLQIVVDLENLSSKLTEILKARSGMTVAEEKIAGTHLRCETAL